MEFTYLNKLFQIQNRIAPEIIRIVKLRYNILRNIALFSPIGRRSLADKLQVAERRVRNHLEFLEQEGLIRSTGAGAVLSARGYEFLEELDEYMGEITGLSVLEEDLRQVLGIAKVVVVPAVGDPEEIKQELGRWTGRLLLSILQEGQILTVTGGTTLAAVAERMPAPKKPLRITVLSGRGGLGEEVEIQANTIAAKIAKKLGGEYRLLYLPDHLEGEDLKLLTQNRRFKEYYHLLLQSNLLLHGIGTAEKMATRRGYSRHQVEELLTEGAVGEAFGYFFSADGRIVHTSGSFGLNLEDLRKIPGVITVAGGEEKAEAILAVVRGEYQDTLITDEGAARRIIQIAER